MTRSPFGKSAREPVLWQIVKGVWEYGPVYINKEAAVVGSIGISTTDHFVFAACLRD